MKVGDLVRSEGNIGLIVDVRNDLPVVRVLWNRDQPFWDEDARNQWIFQHAVELVNES